MAWLGVRFFRLTKPRSAPTNGAAGDSCEHSPGHFGMSGTVHGRMRPALLVFVLDGDERSMPDNFLSQHSDRLQYALVPRAAFISGHQSAWVGATTPPSGSLRDVEHRRLTVNAATATNGSPGRLALGIGLSHKIVVENMWGMSYDKPVRHLREYLSVLMPMVEGKPVSFDGEEFQVHAGVSAPGTTRPGVFVAALGEQMLRVTAALADGTVTWCTGPQTLRAHIVPTLTAAADAAGRPTPRIISALPVCVTGDRPSALARAAALFQMYGFLPSYRAMLDKEGAAGPEDIAIVGNAAEVSDRIRSLADAGITDFTAAEFGGNPDEVAETRQVLQSLL